MIRLTRGRADPGAVAPAPGATWARFGEEVIVLEPEAFRKRRAGLAPPKVRRAGQPLRARRERLHVVVQHGRLFQRHHPRVRVLVDRGRFLLVDLDPVRARQLARAHPTCYGVLSLHDGQTVFDVADRARLRVAPSAAVQAVVDALSRPALENVLTHLASCPRGSRRAPSTRRCPPGGARRWPTSGIASGTKRSRWGRRRAAT